jgi:hypothetical protein
LKDYPRLVTVVYRFVKRNGLMEDRFWALFMNDDKMKEQVKAEELVLPWSSIDAPVQGPAAMFLPPVLDKFWEANPSGLLVKLGGTDASEQAGCQRMIRATMPFSMGQSGF